MITERTEGSTKRSPRPVGVKGGKVWMRSGWSGTTFTSWFLVEEAKALAEALNEAVRELEEHDNE